MGPRIYLVPGAIIAGQYFIRGPVWTDPGPHKREENRRKRINACLAGIYGPFSVLMWFLLPAGGGEFYFVNCLIYYHLIIFALCSTFFPYHSKELPSGTKQRQLFSPRLRETFKKCPIYQEVNFSKIMACLIKIFYSIY